MKKRSAYPLVILCIFVLLLVHSKHHLSSTRYDISAPNLPAAFDGYRIVQLSDLHGMEFGEDNSRLLESVKRLSPDIIALTGDFIENESHLPLMENLVAALAELAPVYFVSGNHDWSSGSIAALRQTIEAQGGHYLSNEEILLKKQNQSIVLVGAEDPNGHADMPSPDSMLETVAASYPHSYIILLAHRNDYVTKYPTLPCDLILTGHGHGGVVRFPIVGGILGTERNLFPKYDAGCFRSNRYTMVVSRGLGGTTPVPRFLNPPEIVCITLNRK